MLNIIGIDEAGRGPLAGPVAVGVALVPIDFNWDLIPDVGDSKKISPKKREAIFKQAQKLKKEGKLNFAVCLVSAKTIDKIGIVPSIQKAMNQALQKIQKSTLFASPNPRGPLGLVLPRGPLGKLEEVGFEDVLVKLDGGLKAPKEYMHQETIIKGDAKEKVIGLASIMAKVTRDRYMIKNAKKSAFSSYAFEIHKGYGTEGHRAKIAQFGLSTEHRVTFCRNVKVWYN
jgi:ribonuclease HII